jgi:glycosyltransferase involved in cell wall biosynthesis
LKKLDLLVIANDFEFLKTHRLDLLEYLNKEGFIISVLTDLDNISDKEREIINNSDIAFRQYKFNRSSINPVTNFVSLVKGFKAIRRKKPKSLFLISSKPIIFGGITSYLLNIKKTVFAITGLGYLFINKDLKSVFFRFIVLVLYKLIFLHKEAKVIFQNEQDRAYFVKKKILSSKKSIIIQGNGIDTKNFSRELVHQTNKVTFLFAGRLLVDKGINEFIEASSLINNQDAEFKLVGDIDLSNPKSLSLDKLDEIKCMDHIDYLGRKDYEEMNSIYNLANIFVLPSYREGLPKSALEAASCEMPLILTDVPGCKECVIESKNGFLVELKNVESLVNKMNFFIQNRQKIASYGIASRKLIEDKFSQEKIFLQFKKIFI